MLHAHQEASDLIYAEGLLAGYRGYDRSGTKPLFRFDHGPDYTDWTYESLAPVSEAIIAGPDLPLVVTVRNSGEGAGREVVQVYLAEPDDNPSSPLQVLAGFTIIDADPGEHTEARLTVPARSLARFDADCPGGSGILGSTGFTLVGRRGTSG